MADEPRKRSRFDQGPPAGDPRSRSRSPSRKEAEPAPTRTRTPPPGEQDSDKKREDAMAAAAAAAAKINASIKSNKGPTSVYVPPIRASGTPDESAGTPATVTADEDGKSYMQNGDYKRDIEIHDYKTRFLVTNAAAQKKIRDDFGVDVTTKGEYYPDKSLATAARPLLHLHITSTTKEALDKAANHIIKTLDGDMPELIDQRRFRPRGQDDEQQQQQQQQRPQIERDSRGRPKWPEEKIPVDLEPIPDFNLRAQVVGQGGQYVKFIVEQSGARVQVKGHGSHWKERDTGEEIDEPMFLHITDRDPDRVAKAAELCRELLENVRSNYDQFKETRNQRGHYGGGGRGGRAGGYGHNGGRQGHYPPGADQYGYGRQQSQDGNGARQGYGGGYGGYGGQQGYDAYSAQSPAQAAYQSPGQYAGQGTPGQGPGGPQASQMGPAGGQQQQQQSEGSVQQWIDYYTAHPDQDPYAQYGGYAAMMQYYQQQQQQQAQQPGAMSYQPHQNSATPNPPGAAYGAGAAGSPPPPPPPPPGAESAPPPPPPPPPPGM